MRARTPLAAVLASLTVLSLAGRAGAESVSSLQRRRDAARAKHAALASRINTLRASDREISAGVRALEAQVRIQSSAADAASRAAIAAQSAVVAAQAKLAATD